MSDGHVLQQSILIPLQDVDVEGFLALPAKSNGLVIFAHGSGSGRLSPRNNYVAQILRSQGLGTLLIDLLSSEEDEIYENRFDIELLSRRLREITEWAICDLQTKGLNLGFFGASTGAAAAVRAAAVMDGRIGAIVSRGGRPDLVMDFLDRVESPTLLIVGGRDTDVLELNKKAYDVILTEKDLVVVPNATHLFSEPGALKQVANLAACWFNKYLSGLETECYLEPEASRRRRSIELAFMGDVMLGRLENEKLENRSPMYPWGDVLPILAETDVRFCNLESVISDMGKPVANKEFHFRTDIKNVDVLKVAGIDAVSLANNHVLDFGPDALLEMVDVLDKNEIGHAGAGENIDWAIKPAMLSARKQRIAFIAFTDNMPEWKANDSMPGIFYCPIDITSNEARVLFGVVEAARKEADIVIVSAHWGQNWSTEVPASHITFSHSLIDAGADIVYGHSPHVVRGIEIYNERPILYSTGDFVDDYTVDRSVRNDESFIFVVSIGSKGVRRIILHPTLIKNMEVLIAPLPEGREISEKMINLCYQFGTECKWNKEKQYLEVLI